MKSLPLLLHHSSITFLPNPIHPKCINLHWTYFELAIPNKPSNAMSKTTMKAVVFKGKLEVKLEDRPIPKIVDPTDVIIKVKYSALCGR